MIYIVKIESKEDLDLFEVLLAKKGILKRTHTYPAKLAFDKDSCCEATLADLNYKFDDDYPFITKLEAVNYIVNGIKPVKEVKWDKKIGTYEVKVLNDDLVIGCTTIKRDQVEELYKFYKNATKA